jgi:hypothetical protein
MHERANGIVKACILQGGGTRSILSAFNIGKGRYYANKKGLEPRKRGGLNGNQISEDDEMFFIEHIKSWQVEEGIHLIELNCFVPCSYARY